MNYRKEIDGLRALAVMPVILFHAGFDTFRGGFIGVDVFFVISGYLITSIILAEKNAGTFSLLNFYERRARRILPALFFVLAVSILFAWFWLLPDELKQFSQSLIAVAIFASNILFWQESGYFDLGVELRPLLHTWSLAVEEQYYVLFPLFIILAWKLGKRWIALLLFVGALTSLGAAQWGAYNKPAATFFLLPTRVWELAIGALLSIYTSQRQQIQISNEIRQFGSILGLLLILYAVFVFSSNTPYPSLYGLVPTIGTALIILCATPLTLVGRVLASKLIVAIGLISYSAYLWHQPLFAFARQRSLTEPSKLTFLWLSIAALALAYFSWRFIERPFRQPGVITREKVFVFSVVGSLLFVVIGAIGIRFDGFSARFTPQERAVLRSAQLENVRKEMMIFQRGVCFADLQQNYMTLIENQCVSNLSEKPRAIVFGDSHAAHLYSGVKDVFGRAGYNTQQWTAAGCRAINLPGNSKRCKDFYSAFVRDVLPQLKQRDVIIVSSYWLGVLKGNSTEEISSALSKLTAALDRTDVTVVVVGSSPAFKKAPQVFMVRAGISDAPELSLESMNNQELNKFLQKEAEYHGLLFFNPSDAFCGKSTNQSCLVKKGNQFLFLDDSHFNEFGSLFVMRYFWSKFEAGF